MSLKQLPVPTVVVPPTNQPQVKQFKSQSNLKIERDSKICVIKNSIRDILIPKNTSSIVQITYQYDFGYVPQVYYSVACADAEFKMTHYLQVVTSTSCDIAICNEADQDRTISISYRIE